jgi:hypothetical protein
MAVVGINIYGFVMCGLEGSRKIQAQGNSAPFIQYSYLTMMYFCVIRNCFILIIRPNKVGNIVQRNIEVHSCKSFAVEKKSVLHILSMCL